MIETLDEDKCNGCYACVELCTKDVYRFDENRRKPIIAYRNDCQTCFTCELCCPVDAIYVHPIHRQKVFAWPPQEFA